MKVSNKNSRKEFEICQKMKHYLNEHQFNIRLMDMSMVHDVILSRPVGQTIKKDHLHQQQYIYITQILILLSIGHKLGLVHRDIRIQSVVLFNNDYAYLIDWDSSTCNGMDLKGNMKEHFHQCINTCIN